MRVESITKCAEALAKEISEQRTLDIPSLKMAIELRMMDGLEQFVFDLMSEIDKERMYIKKKMALVTNQNTYAKLGFELSLLNDKAKVLKSRSDYHKLKDFVRDNSPETLSKFIEHDRKINVCGE